MHATYDEIKSIWQNTRTETTFSANQPLINTVSARTNGSANYPYVALHISPPRRDLTLACEVDLVDWLK